MIHVLPVMLVKRIMHFSIIKAKQLLFLAVDSLAVRAMVKTRKWENAKK
jgi:hypothetical protein